MSEHNNQAMKQERPDRKTGLEQARQACLARDYRAAYSLYDELLKEFPGDPAVLLDYGRAKFREFADLEQSARLLLQAVEADPDAIDALLWLAEVSAMGYGQGYAKAASLYQRVLKLDPQCVDAYIGLAMLYRAPSSPVTQQDALAAYRKAAQLAPQRIDVHHNLGYSLAEAGDSDAAQREFLTTVQLLRTAGREPEAPALQAVLEQLQRQEPLKSWGYRNESTRFNWPEQD